MHRILQEGWQHKEAFEQQQNEHDIYIEEVKNCLGELGMLLSPQGQDTGFALHRSQCLALQMCSELFA